MNISKIKQIFHDVFITGIIIKGINGTLELVGGIALALIRTDTILNVVQKLFQHELIEEPNDFLANFFIQAAHNLSIGTLSFVSIYFIVHGFIKIILFFGLWNKKSWAYPTTAVVLFLSIIYDSFRIFHTYSKVLIFFTLVDVLILVLLRFEYKRQETKII